MTIGYLVPWNTGRRRYGLRNIEDPFTTLWQETSKLFENMASESNGDTIKGGFIPALHVEEDEGVLKVTAELPGMDEKDVDISLTKDALTIRGEKREETKKEEGKRYYSEVRYGSFERTIPLHFEVDTDKVEASYKKGVLTVKLPKSAQAQKEAKKISIKTT